MRWALGLLLLVSTSLALAQGGAAGYGQGGGGGGGMGGGGGFGGGSFGGDPNAAPDDRVGRPEEDSQASLWETRTAILTPGNKVEFKIAMHRGETLFASATSDAFDPALAVEDAKGKTLAQNDDRTDGDQAPFVAVRVPEDGTYTLKVLGFKSVAGGKFTLKTRTFLALDAPLGPAVHAAKHQGGPDNNRLFFRIAAKKGKIYDLKNVSVVQPYRSTPNLIRIVGPTGVERNDSKAVTTPGNSPVFEALADGDYYAEYQDYAFAQDRVDASLRTDFREVGIVAAKTSGEVSFDLGAGELKVVEFPVTADLIVRSAFVGRSLTEALSAPAGPVRADQVLDLAYGNNRFWAWFLVNRDTEDDVVRVFHGAGMARFAVRSNAKDAQKVTLKNSESLPAWTSGEALKGEISIGDVRLFLVRSTKSELMKVYAKSPQFQVKLDIFRLNGELANSIMDRKAHVATDDLYFPDADTFIVRLSCDGYGGSGEYALKRDSLAPQPYVLGTAGTVTLDASSFGLYSVDLEAGKRYQLTTDQPGKALRADLLDDDGQFLVSQAIAFDDVLVQYFVPTRSGRHRLWLRGEPGPRRFKLELHVPPKIGG